MTITQSQYLQKLLKHEKQKRDEAEQQNHQHRAHLLASQRVAKVGSWEVKVDPGNINVISDNLKDLYFSEETYNLLELGPDAQLDYRLYFSTVHPEDMEAVQQRFFEALSKRSSYEMEHRVLTPAGKIKTVRSRAEISLDEEQNMLIVKGTVLDISDKKEVDEKLDRATQELSTLFANMQEVFYSVDMQNYHVVQMSPACEKMYGYKAEDFFRNRNLWLETILEEDRPIIFNNHAVLERGEPLVQEYRIRHRNGEIKWIESRIQPTLDGQGQLVRLDGLSTDITERKQAETALKESESKFRLLIENSTDGIKVIDEQFRVTYASDSIQQVLGYTPEEMIGKHAMDLLPEEDIPQNRELLEEVLENPGKAVNTTCRRLKKDGTVIWCDCTLTNLLHEPLVKGIVTNFRDVTKRKVDEDALQASNEELRKSNSELDKFVYSVSHDLRAPLASMLGIVEMSEPDITDPLIQMHFGMLKQSIHKLDGFINDILDYSRNARIQVKAGEVNLKDLAEEVSSNLKFMDGNGARVAIKINIPEGMILCTDRSRLMIILNNLLSNAIRYSEPERNEPYVQVTAKQSDGTVELLVEDNGIGISNDNRDKVFEMFYRATSRSAGSGLGLYIVKEAVQKLNGHIELESEPNVGSTFRIILPQLLTN